jgi:hypothetical protein
MPIAYEEVLPWGRSYDEYLRMFHLDEGDLGKRLLGCGDGPAAFNACIRRRGGRIVSVDPLYHFDRKQILARIHEVTGTILEQTGKNAHLFRWDTIRDLSELARLRHAAMAEFLDDYETGLADARYVAAELPRVPFENKGFDLALCSHLLFLYSDQLDLDFHVESIREMLRMANEVRIFPVVDMNAKTSCHLSEILRLFNEAGEAHLEKVDYEFQIGANQMLRILGA